MIPFVCTSENEGYPHLYFCVLVSESLKYFFLIFLGYADMVNGDEFVNGAQHSRGTSFPRCLMPWERPGPWLALGSRRFFCNGYSTLWLKKKRGKGKPEGFIGKSSISCRCSTAMFDYQKIPSGYD